MATQGITPLSASDFDALVLAADRPVLVDFTAPWCTPCQMLGAYLPKLAGEWGGMLDMFAVDTDDNHDLCRRWGVTSFPQLLLFHRGLLVHRVGGFDGYAALRADIAGFLSGATGRPVTPSPREASFAASALLAESIYEAATLPAAEALGDAVEPHLERHEANLAALDQRRDEGAITRAEHSERTRNEHRRLRGLVEPQLARQRDVTATALASFRDRIGAATAAFLPVAATGRVICLPTGMCLRVRA